MGHENGHIEDEKAEEIVRMREMERELEQERPCLFKSLSPVSLQVATCLVICADAGVGLEQRQSHSLGGKDTKPFGLVCEKPSVSTQLTIDQCPCPGVDSTRSS